MLSCTRVRGDRLSRYMCCATRRVALYVSQQISSDDSQITHLILCPPKTFQKNPRVRKCFLSAILGPEMAAPILWARGKNSFFLQDKPMSIKFLVLRGGGGILCFWGGGGEVAILFLWARGFF